MNNILAVHTQFCRPWLTAQLVIYTLREEASPPFGTLRYSGVEGTFRGIIHAAGSVTPIAGRGFNTVICGSCDFIGDVGRRLVLGRGFR